MRLMSWNQITIRLIKYILILILLIFILNIIFLFFTVNYSNSFPIGLYFNKNIKHIDRGKLYIFCPDYDEKMKFAEQNGFWQNIDKSCGKTPKYLKKALGLPFDKILITDEGVYINDKLIMNTELILKDKIYRKDEFILKSDEYIMLSDYNKYSYDSRYFGVIKLHQIKKEVIPIITKK